MPRYRSLLYCTACVSAFVLATLGCGQSETYHPVTGKITLNGQPLPDADISFMPEDDKGEPAFGVTDAQGVYQLRQTQTLAGALPGEYRIRISTFRGAREEPDPRPEVPERVPARYNVHSQLTREVTPGENNLDFQLESKPGG